MQNCYIRFNSCYLNWFFFMNFQVNIRDKHIILDKLCFATLGIKGKVFRVTLLIPDPTSSTLPSCSINLMIVGFLENGVNLVASRIPLSRGILGLENTTLSR